MGTELDGVPRDEVQGLQLVQASKAAGLLEPVGHRSFADHQRDLAVRLLDQHLSETNMAETTITDNDTNLAKISLVADQVNRSERHGCLTLLK